MSSGIDFSVKIANYKCFGSEPQGFERLTPLNLIVGRNNVGKSALLDVIELAVGGALRVAPEHWHNRRDSPPRLQFSKALERNELLAVFPEGTHGGTIPGRDHWEYGQRWMGTRATWQLSGAQPEMVALEKPFTHNGSDIALKNLARVVGNPLLGRRIRRLRADRDIKPEQTELNPSLGQDGLGATSAIEAFLHCVNYQSSVVEELLLGDLNYFFRPDGIEFERIIARTDAHRSRWELYLVERGKGQVALSHSGSGLKTLLLVLCVLHLGPRLMGGTLQEQQILLFEELENNLHPALQRRLVLYLRDFAVRTQSLLFLTTHSSATIDLFSADPDAQVIHVSHDNNSATATTVSTYIQRRGVLDDLDIRASDLLQANCVVWVEGPTDRLYVNRWLHLWTDGNVREGVHYQCVFYGGRLLSHLSGEVPDVDPTHGIHLLSVNRNVVIIIDSDRRSASDGVNDTKSRLVAEVSRVGGLAWITAGREIENYVPVQAIAASFEGSNPSPVEQYASIGDYLASMTDQFDSATFSRKKVAFAEQVCSAMTRDGLVATLDLENRLNDLVAYIGRCNGERVRESTKDLGDPRMRQTDQRSGSKHSDARPRP